MRNGDDQVLRLAPDIGALFLFDNHQYVLQGWLRADRAGLLVFCRRSEATCLYGRGLRGCAAPLEAVRVVGRASWSDHQLRTSRAYANELAAAAERCAAMTDMIAPDPGADEPEGRIAG